MSIIARTGAALVALVAVLALGVSSAAASTPMPVSGTFTYGNPTSAVSVQHGGNTFVTITCPVVFTGTLIGTATVQGTGVFHADGSVNFREVEIFTGTVNGVPGTLTLTEDGTGQTAYPGAFLGHSAIVSGTGMLANLHGVIDAVGTAPQGNPLGTYSGQILSAPSRAPTQIEMSGGAGKPLTSTAPSFPLCPLTMRQRRGQTSPLCLPLPASGVERSARHSTLTSPKNS